MRSLLLLLLLGGLSTRAAEGQEEPGVYARASQADWEEWIPPTESDPDVIAGESAGFVPAGVLDYTETGGLTLRFFEQNINAAADASSFLHFLPSDKNQTSPAAGGVFQVGSTAPREPSGNCCDAEFLIDDNPETYWKPDLNDDPSDWWVVMDLGRAVPVYQIRLLFPDEEGARPVPDFRIVGSDGTILPGGRDTDSFAFEILGGTTSFNDQPVMEFDLESLPEVGTEVLFQELGAAERTDISYRTLQYIRFQIDDLGALTDEPAMAELQAWTFGVNVASGIAGRGGSWFDLSVDPDKFERGILNPDHFVYVDGNMHTSKNGSPKGEGNPFFWRLDLGTIFFVDRLLMLGAETTGPARRGGTQLNRAITDHELLSSDGTLKPDGSRNFQQISVDVDDFSKIDFQYIFATPQKYRYLAAVFDPHNGKMSEVMVVPTGHVARVELQSPFIDLGEIARESPDDPTQAQRISRLNIDAITPPGTSVKVSTRTGQEVGRRVEYFDKRGNAKTEEEYNELKTALQGPQITTIIAGSDWSAWSTPYEEGDGFLSPSPRKLLQVRLILETDDPTVAPVVNSLEFVFDDAAIRDALAEVTPREAQPGVAQPFTYTIWGDFSDPDTFFDRLLFLTPSPVDTNQVVVQRGGPDRWVDAEATISRATSDSLVFELAEPVVAYDGAVVGDTVQVQMDLTINRNPTQLKAFIGQSGQEGVWQLVNPDSNKTAVFFTELITDLLSEVAASPQVVTPNGDGTGDQTDISFTVFNVEIDPIVTIYSLDGRAIRQLTRVPGSTGALHQYSWDGQDRAGQLVPPGLYLYRVDLPTQQNDRQITGTVGVAY